MYTILVQDLPRGNALLKCLSNNCCRNASVTVVSAGGQGIGHNEYYNEPRQCSESGHT